MPQNEGKIRKTVSKGEIQDVSVSAKIIEYTNFQGPFCCSFPWSFVTFKSKLKVKTSIDLVGGLNPIEKYELVKLDHFPK